MTDNTTDSQVREPTGEDPDGTVDVATSDQEIVGSETQANAHDPVVEPGPSGETVGVGEDETETGHTIIKEGVAQYRTTFEYDEETQDLVIDDEENWTRLRWVRTTGGVPAERTSLSSPVRSTTRETSTKTPRRKTNE